MKRIITVISLALALSACAQEKINSSVINNDEHSHSDSTSSLLPKLKDGTVNIINENEFALLIADWKNDSEWNFKGTKPAIVDFNASWCGPCRQLEPILKRLAKDYAGKIDFYSIDVDDNRSLARTFGISSIPFVIICPVGDNPQALVGFHPREELIEAIESITKIKNNE